MTDGARGAGEGRRRIISALDEMPVDHLEHLVEVTTHVTPTQIRLAARDAILRMAFAELVADRSISQAAVELAAKLSAYASRGWLKHREVSELPAGLSREAELLCRFMRLNGGRTLGYQQIENVLLGARGG